MHRKATIVTASIVVGALLVCLVAYSRLFSVREVFRRFTGLYLPRSATVIRDEYTNAGAFGSDSYHCIEVKVTDDTIASWLNVAPFHSAAQWKNGPVVEPVLRLQNTVPGSALDSRNAYYALDAREQDGGSLIVLDTKNQKAWLLLW
jgi:hypothetical protein